MNDDELAEQLARAIYETYRQTHPDQGWPQLAEWKRKELRGVAQTIVESGGHDIATAFLTRLISKQATKGS